MAAGRRTIITDDLTISYLNCPDRIGALGRIIYLIATNTAA